MRTIAVTGNETIRIGRVGENRAVQIIWPGLLEKWRELYGDGTVQLAARRPKDTAPYPVVCEVRENDVTWTVQAADTARHGIGECELTYLAGEKVAKSQTWATEILRSLTEDETVEPPNDPAKAWYMKIRQEIGDLSNLTTTARDNLVAAINEAAKSGGTAADIRIQVADGYIQYSTDGGKSWNNLIAMKELIGPAGPKGDTGPTGADGKSAYQYAQEGGYTGTETEFAAKMAREKFANPNALTFTGAVTGSYDGSAPLSVEIPQGGGGGGGAGAKEFRLIQSITLDEQSDRVDISVDSSGAAFALHEVYVMIAAQSYEDAYHEVNFLPNGRWGASDAFIASANKASKSSETWKNNMAFHSVYTDGIICSEQLPAKGQNNSLSSSFAINQAIITKISIACKFAAGCTFLVIGR